MHKKKRIEPVNDGNYDSDQKQQTERLSKRKQTPIKKSNVDSDEIYYSDTNKDKRLSMLIIAMIVVLGIAMILHQNLILTFSISDPNAQPDIKQKSEQFEGMQIQIPRKQEGPSQRTSFMKADEASSVKSNNLGTQPSFRSPIQTYASRVSLDDFTTDSVYQQASQQMKDIFDEMIARPQQMISRNRPNMIFIPSQKAHFAYSLHLHPQNKQYAKAEYYYYDQKYKIGNYRKEAKVCIVAPGRNIVSGGQYKKFIDSINRQNYSNYQLVYVDDVSDDGSVEQLQQYVRETDGPLNKEGRLQIIQNTQRVYALANRNNAIRNHCDDDSIVADVDADDAFIGRQVFKFVNAIYQDPKVWQFNSVFIYVDRDHQQVTTGPQEGVPKQLLQQNRYRGSLIWKTSELRTFKARLFKKIDESDFKNQKGQFYKWASDVFTQVPLVQLAGPEHYKHLFQILYFYNWQFDRTTIYKRRHYRDIAWMQTPYKPLQSLDDEAVKEENYQVNEYMKLEYEKNLKQAQIQAKRYDRVDIF